MLGADRPTAPGGPVRPTPAKLRSAHGRIAPTARGRRTRPAPAGAGEGPLAATDGRVPGQRGRATRQRLLESTVELLVTTPWRSVKVIDIARRAGTSPATFYQYFENVEQAIGVLAEEMVAEAAELADLVAGDWSRALELGDGALRDRGVPRLLGGQPGGLPGGRPGHRGGRRRPAGGAGAGPQRRHRGPGPGHHRPRRRPGRARRGPSPARRPARTPWPWPARWSPCTPAWPPIATASSSGASGRPRLVDSQARLLHWSVTGRPGPPGVVGRRPLRVSRAGGAADRPDAGRCGGGPTRRPPTPT